MRQLTIRAAIRKTSGYTLVELIVVIILLGIVGLFTFNYVGFGTRIYVDTTGREQLVSQSRFAVERLSRELRNAVPRSIRVSELDAQRCIEFIPIITSSNYLQIPRPGPTSTADFIAVEPIRAAEAAGNSLYVYATNQNFLYGNSELRRKTIDVVSFDTPEPGLVVFEYSASPSFFPTDSPARRYYVGGSPVSWCYNEAANRLERYRNYGLLASQLSHSQLLAAASYEIMAVDLVNDLSTPDELPFRVFEATLQRNNLVEIDWRFRRSSDNESLQLLHEVHAPNVP